MRCARNRGRIGGVPRLDLTPTHHYPQPVRHFRPHLYFGPSVHATDLPRLRRAGITAVLSLQQPRIDVPLAAIERMRAACEPRIAYRNMAVHDYDPDALIAALPDVLASLQALIGDGRIVYVHCSEGINRAPSVALAYVIHHERLDVDDALAELRRCDPGAKPYQAVIKWLRVQYSSSPR
jgi:dual specificity protein phosphatase-like protein